MTAASTSDATPSALQPRNEEHDDVVFVKCLVEGESHGVHPSTTTTTLTPTEQAVSTNRGPGTPYQGTFFPRFSGDSVRTGRFAPQSQAAARITTGEGQLQSSGPHPGYRTAFLSIDGMTKAQMTVKLHESVAATFQWASLMSENDDEGVQQLGAELKELRNMCTVLQQQLEVQKRQNSALEIRLNSIEDIAGNTESQVKETKTKVEETTTKLCSLDQRMMRISRVFTALDG
ncbi:hypothetical protein BJY04DRAFT_41753 [Aspergillus karnatakaensis]|uniref:uncharacterized protein n=1 Tax=Aspergillus karnatakaensis TaxID=1810916 RepID=UPI003CCE4FA8